MKVRITRQMVMYRLRQSRNLNGYRVLVVSGVNKIHEGFESADARRLRRTLRQLGYIN